jgi:hypothetical protein
MIEVIPDQGAFRLTDRLFDRVQLLRNIKAWTAALDHVDDAAQMSLGPLQPFDDIGVTLVDVLLFHSIDLSPWRGYCQGN